jgi:C1A family cysteine protease
MPVPQIETASIEKEDYSTIEIDWQTLGAVGPIKSQGNCGAAGAFSTMGGIEGLVFITTGKF